MLAGEQSRMMMYFVPQLGPAPRWCSFLEGLTEELEETAGQNVYEDYKFVTKTEVEELGATGLIGTPMLKGYMHGFFLEMKLYNKLRAVSKPFEFEEHRKRKIDGKIEEKRQSRIIAQKRLPKVNADLAQKMIKQSAALKTKAGDAEAAGGNGDTENIIDSRFASLFKREEFERDELSSEFKLRNPSKGNNQKRSGNDDSDDELQDLYAPVELDDDGDDSDDDYDNDGDGSNSHDDDDSDIDQIRNNDNDDDDDDDEVKVKDKSKKRKNRKATDSDEEGEIFRATARALEHKKLSALRSASATQKKTSKPAATVKSSSSSSSSGSKGNSKPSSSIKMYEIADGVSTSRAVFSHTEEAKGLRRGDRALSAVPLLERVATTGDKADY
jgi:ribosome biogenesis protein ENP2